MYVGNKGGSLIRGNWSCLCKDDLLKISHYTIFLSIGFPPLLSGIDQCKLIYIVGLAIISLVLGIFIWMSIDGKKETLPYVIFLLVGILLLSVAYNISNEAKYEFLSEILLNLGVVTVTVTLIAALWRFLGGNPLLESIERLQTSTSLLSDLENSGIVRIFPQRRMAPEYEFLQLESAKKVGVMGHILRDNLVRNDELMDKLKDRTGEGELELKIILLDPSRENNILKQLSIDEAKWSDKEDERIIAQEASFKRLSAELENSLNELSSKRKFNVRVADNANMYCNIVRADDRLVVTKYLLSVRGGGSPTLFIRGEDTPYYKMFSKEFDDMWRRSKPLAAHKSNEVTQNE